MSKNKGVWIAFIIIFLWIVSLLYGLSIKIDFANPLTYILMLVQTHLYTGLFITAHDAMHGTVSPNKRLNRNIGRLAAILFAFNFYDRLFTKHHEHHRFVATEKDPDYHGGNFFVWYFSFIKQYITWKQLLLMAITFNALELAYPKANIIMIWMIPSILSTLQLFYFGTFLPHRGTHNEANRHKSRSQKKNDFVAFITCYFFGYHYEHHASPGTPWWQLSKAKQKYAKEIEELV